MKGRTKVQTKMFTNSIRQRVLALAAGESVEFSPYEVSANTLRHYASLLGKQNGREFHLRTIKARKTYIITREA